MRYLGIDYGTKHLGIAVSDDAGSFAFPRDVLSNDAKAVEKIFHIVEKENIEGIVIGDTRFLNGGANTITESSDTFAENVELYCKIAVHRVREAWSSAEADRYAPQGRKHSDSAAAAIILQRFLDSRSKSE